MKLIYVLVPIKKYFHLITNIKSLSYHYLYRRKTKLGFDQFQEDII